MAGIVERVKNFGKEIAYTGGEAYIGLILVTMTPIGWPTLFGMFCIHHSIERGKKALAF